ncbi:MAG: type II secretion system F family protein [Armatimonadetes bacterium]|nr:type II secretion system F family protein [Armatimonadota bacterium]
MVAIGIAIGVFVVVAAVLLLVLMSRGRGGTDLVARLGAAAAPRREPSRPAPRPAVRTADRLPLLTALLQNLPWWEEVQLELLRAGILLKPSELLVGIFLSAILGAGLGYLLLRGVLGSLLFLLLGAAVPWIWVKAKQAKRNRDLMNQLPDTIDLVATALRSGFSFLRAVQLIASQMQPPIADEFRRLAQEVQMGMSMDDALDNLVERTRCYDLELLVAAVQIHLTVGGNLSEILDNISGTIRERVRLQGEIAAATAEGRMSAAVLIAMPFAIAMIINVINPGYIRPLFSTPMGLGMTLMAGVLMGIGAMVIRRMVEIDV